jgi:hypothetical protein
MCRWCAKQGGTKRHRSILLHCEWRDGFVRSPAVEKRELSKIDFEMIDDAFKALLQSSYSDPVVEAKIVDLRDKFRDAFTGWLEIEEAA